MNMRLLELRKALKLSQEAFGEKLGVTRSSVSNMETGRFNITETMVKLICSTFNVNEGWFRTGEGQMLNTSPDATFAHFLGTLFNNKGTDDSLDAFERRTIETLSKLTVYEWEFLRKIVYQLAGKELED